MRIIPGLQATALVVKNIPKKYSMKPSKKMGMKKKPKNLVKRATETLIGIGLIRPTAQMINRL